MEQLFVDPALAVFRLRQLLEKGQSVGSKHRPRRRRRRRRCRRIETSRARRRKLLLRRAWKRRKTCFSRVWKKIVGQKISHLGKKNPILGKHFKSNYYLLMSSIVQFQAKWIPSILSSSSSSRHGSVEILRTGKISKWNKFSGRALKFWQAISNSLDRS